SGRAGRLAGTGSFARRAGLLARRLARAAGAAPGPGAAPLAGYPGLAHAHRSPPAGLVAPAARSPRAGSRSERATAPRRRLDRGAARPCLLPMENPGRIIRFAGSPGFTLRQGNMLIVQKYGGTSMGSVERIQNVARRVAKWHAAGHQVVVVPSAMAGETNRLLGLAKEISPQPDLRELDMLAATGEQASSALLAIALMRQGVAARSYAGWQVPVRTDSAYTKARIRSIDDTRIRTDLDAGRVVIVTGFQGIDDEGHITTLGRGGSDTSAVAVAAAMGAEECLIFTDVDGVYTTDPRVVPEARRMRVVSFEEMLEMASLGSKVLQIRAVEFAGKYQVPVRVLSSLTDPLIPLDEEMSSGTLITFEEDQKMESAVVSGIAFSR